jgi:hypothetical protein
MKFNNCRATGLRLKFGFEHEGTWAIIPTYREHRLLRRKEPTTVLDCPEQSGEARSRIEARPAQPIDRAVTANQSSGRTDAYEHGSTRVETC